MEIEVREMGAFHVHRPAMQARPIGQGAGRRDVRRGRGYKSVAGSLGIPAEAVRKWQQTHRATGRDGLLKMGEKRSRCDFETKVALPPGRGRRRDGQARGDGALRHRERDAAEAVVQAVPRGGAEALRPRPRGRPRVGPRRRPASRSSSARSGGSRRRWRTQENRWP